MPVDVSSCLRLSLSSLLSPIIRLGTSLARLTASRSQLVSRDPNGRLPSKVRVPYGRCRKTRTSRSSGQ
jgi:hypothetical protein